ncbi:MAG: hypothetical protein IT428_26425 [Planctomycetaceae bacterium]|nr:hypothetical protein [Planctomycetaceae bacterium]
MIDLQSLADLLIRGASLQIALAQLGRTPIDILDDVSRPEIQGLLVSVRRVLTNNLTASLYRRAMEGSIPALTFWLAHFPDSPFHHQGEGSKDRYATMSDAELMAEAKALGMTLEDLTAPLPGDNLTIASPPDPFDFPEEFPEPGVEQK